jgi:hypothetical protein
LWPVPSASGARNFMKNYRAYLCIFSAFLSPCVFMELDCVFDPAEFEHGAQTTNNDRLRHAAS